MLFETMTESDPELPETTAQDLYTARKPCVASLHQILDWLLLCHASFSERGISGALRPAKWEEESRETSHKSRTEKETSLGSRRGERKGLMHQTKEQSGSGRWARHAARPWDMVLHGQML